MVYKSPYKFVEIDLIRFTLEEIRDPVQYINQSTVSI